MPKTTVAVCHWLPDGVLPRWTNEFAQCEFVDARTRDAQEQHLPHADATYGLPDLQVLEKSPSLRWVQLASAGVPAPLCGLAKSKRIRVTNLSGLYGPTIAEHALGMMLVLSRNLQVAQRNQASKTWDRDVANTMRDLQGRTLAIFGLGDIGVSIARLAKAFGMRVVGCSRTGESRPHVDQVYSRGEVKAMFAEAQYAAVAAPLTPTTEGRIGADELRALKPGGVLVNVSRGPIVQEAALVEALQSGHLGGAGLDVFAVEPLQAEHPLWALPNVVVSPHYSGETVNLSDQPAQRFARNLRSWTQGAPFEGDVDLDQGY